MKVVINTCYGGFGLSPEAEAAYLLRKGKEAFFYVQEHNGKELSKTYRRVPVEAARDSFMFTTTTKDLGERAKQEQVYDKEHYFYGPNIDRDDPDLVAVVEELGDRAAGNHAKLAIVEIPDGVQWGIEEYDGTEWVAEAHRTWS